MATQSREVQEKKIFKVAKTAPQSRKATYGYLTLKKRIPAQFLLSF